MLALCAFFLTRVIYVQLFLQKFVFYVCFIFLSRLVLWNLKNFAVSWLLCRMSRRWIDVCCLDVTHCGWLGSKHQLTDYLTDCCKVTVLVTFSLRLMLNPSRAVCVIILPSVLLATGKRESACLAVTEAEFLASPLAEVWKSWFEFSCTFKRILALWLSSWWTPSCSPIFLESQIGFAQHFVSFCFHWEISAFFHCCLFPTWW